MEGETNVQQTNETKLNPSLTKISPDIELSQKHRVDNDVTIREQNQDEKALSQMSEEWEKHFEKQIEKLDAVKRLEKQKRKLNEKPKIKQRFHKRNGVEVNTSDLEETHPSWFELLFDLIVVVASHACVTQFVSEIDHGVHYSPCLFVMRLFPLLNTWLGVDQYLNRFGHAESYFDALYMFIQFNIMAAICISLQVYESAEGDEDKELFTMMCYSIGMMCSHGATFLMYCRVVYHDPEATGFAANTLVWELLMIGWWALVGFSSQGKSTVWILWGVATVLEYLKEIVIMYIFSPWKVEKLITDRPYVFVPQNVALFYERLGLLVLIAIGEIMASIHGSDISSETIGKMILVVTQGFLFKFAYFDIFDCMGLHAEKTASKISKNMGVAFLRVHFLLIACIVYAPIYMEHETESKSEHRRLGAEETEATTDDSDSAYSVKIYHQLAFAISSAGMLTTSYILGQLHDRTEAEKLQRVPKYIRRAFLFISVLFYILAAGFNEFEEPKILFGISCIGISFFLLVEFLCTWIFVVIPDPKTEGSSISEPSKDLEYDVISVKNSDDNASKTNQEVTIQEDQVQDI